MPNIFEMLPDAEAILQMEPEELAGYFLRLFADWYDVADRQRSSHPKISSYNVGMSNWVEGYPRPLQEKVSHAFMEAWQWLENHEFIAPEPGEDRRFGQSFLTRHARRVVASSGGLVEFIRTTNLRRDALHSVLAEKVWPTYIRGDFETAVFQAFKQVEIAVRTAAGFDSTKYGVDLMREAFKPSNGPLADESATSSEKEAASALFAGAIGLFKNPPSHREVNYDDPNVAAEAISFASLLLRLVDERR